MPPVRTRDVTGELDTTTLRALGAELVELDVGEAGLEAGKAIL